MVSELSRGGQADPSMAGSRYSEAVRRPLGSYRYHQITPSTTPIAGAQIAVSAALSEWSTIRSEIIKGRVCPQKVILHCSNVTELGNARLSCVEPHWDSKPS